MNLRRMSLWALLGGAVFYQGLRRYEHGRARRRAVESRTEFLHRQIDAVLDRADLTPKRPGEVPLYPDAETEYEAVWVRPRKEAA